MGCDIHLHTEVKIEGTWHHYSCPNVTRNYHLFGKIAGVRDEDQIPVAPVRGLPDDATFLTKYDYKSWAVCAHHVSWLNAEEIRELEAWLSSYLGRYSWSLEPDYWGYLFGNSWGGWEPGKDGQLGRDGVEDIRFVFWFDN